MLGKQLQTAAAGNAGEGVYVEDVFSTYLYNGNDSTNTITNGIDLAGEGGLVWLKARDNTYSHWWMDTARGFTNGLKSESTAAQANLSSSVGSVSSTGFSLTGRSQLNASPYLYASWTFRKAEKFFDVVTWSGTGSSNPDRRITHSLGSEPGTIIFKRSDASSAWFVYHRSVGYNQYLVLNATSAPSGSVNFWGSGHTSTTFGINETNFGITSGNWVAYLFAHDAGGFGDDGTESVIKCGTFTCDGGGNVGTVSLGWEPQWILAKHTEATSGWFVFDTMRGWDLSNNTYLQPNLSYAENSFGSSYFAPTATGFSGTGNFFGPNAQVIYIAIRRGPMKKPTDATKVFTVLATSSGSTGTSRTVGFPADFALARWRSGATAMQAVDRLRGMPTSSSANALLTSSTAAEAGYSPYMYDVWNTTAKDGANANLNSVVWQYFRRAHGFFDVVAYTGTGSARTVNHNLGVVPEMIIAKSRNGSEGWIVYAQGIGNNFYLRLELGDAKNNAFDPWNSTNPTSSVFSLGTSGPNSSGNNYIAYLFASCPGVSKVGSYTGTGTTLDVDCGFSAGARFVMIKRTDASGDWLVWDTARGIVSGTDPTLRINLTLAEASTDWIDPLSTGFQIPSSGLTNANGGSYIFLAIA